MGTLYITAIQPNPPGKDRGMSGNLNNEWVEFMVDGGNRDLAGDELVHITFTSYGCTITGEDILRRFSSQTLQAGHSFRVHSGRGQDYWEGTRYHHFLNRNWYVWNNACGDRVTLRFNANVIDWAEYTPNPPERVLYRVPGTRLLR